MKNLDPEIFRILTLAGKKGLKTDRIARHVFNSCNSMFNPLDYKAVHVYVSQFLIRNSKRKDSWVEKCDGHGVYRLDRRSREGRQFMLQFANETQNDGDDMREKEGEEPKGMDEDTSLSLF